MLATEILIQDHLQAINLIEKLEGVHADEPGTRNRFAELQESLELHMREEEEIYYPALIEHKEFDTLLNDSVPEHETVRANLAQMSELSPADTTFQTLLTETKAALEAHKKEEDEIFPRSIELLGEDRINELGNEIDQLKGEVGLSQSARI